MNTGFDFSFQSPLNRQARDWNSYVVKPLLRDYQLIGDSHLVRFADQILHQSNRMINGARTIGHCVSGQRIDQLRKRIKLKLYPLTSKVMLLIGTNDVLCGGTYQTMIKHFNRLFKLLKKTVEKLVILTLPPIPKLSVTYYHWTIVRQYNTFLRSLHDGSSVIVADICPLFTKFTEVLEYKLAPYSFKKGCRLSEKRKMELCENTEESFRSCPRKNKKILEFGEDTSESDYKNTTDTNTSFESDVLSSELSQEVDTFETDRRRFRRTSSCHLGFTENANNPKPDGLHSQSSSCTRSERSSCFSVESIVKRGPTSRIFMKSIQDILENKVKRRSQLKEKPKNIERWSCERQRSQSNNREKNVCATSRWIVETDEDSMSDIAYKSQEEVEYDNVEVKNDLNHNISSEFLKYIESTNDSKTKRVQRISKTRMSLNEDQENEKTESSSSSEDETAKRQMLPYIDSNFVNFLNMSLRSSEAKESRLDVFNGREHSESRRSSESISRRRSWNRRDSFAAPPTPPPMPKYLISGYGHKDRTFSIDGEITNMYGGQLYAFIECKEIFSLYIDEGMNNLYNDLKGIARALELVLYEQVKYQQNCLGRVWNNSSIRVLVEDKVKDCGQNLRTVTSEDVSKKVKETFERASMVAYGLRAYASYSSQPQASPLKPKGDTQTNTNDVFQPHITNLPKGVSPEDLKISELNLRDKELIEKLEREHEKKLKEKELKRLEEEKLEKENYLKNYSNDSEVGYEVKPFAASIEKKLEEENEVIPQQPSVKKYVPKKQQLSAEAKQRKVPSSRLARMVTFGSLAASLGVGAVAEATRRTLGFGSAPSEETTVDQLLLSEANVERIVSTLCRVRGAALKIGQILSIQDNTVISPVLQKAFERVRQSADFMPTWQAHKVLVKELGQDWRDKLDCFEEKPFAAASIGQVHHVRLKDGRECAMKIQYPGVAQGIESDINNLVGILKVWNVFPKGMFIDNLVQVAKRELSWEVDYTREAECTKKFKELLAPYPDYVVPEVIDELSTAQIFTSTLIDGVPVDQCAELEEEHRKRIAKLIMKLCLMEIFEFMYMQTDPNWSNFFYDPHTKKLSLLDFGATRSYDKKFIEKYIRVIKAGADGDRATVLEISREMGFLTGYESKTMEDAHANAVMILAEVFSSEKAFDFGQQDTTARITKLVPTIVTERLCPPPEEIYSLHRKLSGVFLLCTKLKVKISCREMFLQVYDRFEKEGR